jgi:hypothetical protein
MAPLKIFGDFDQDGRISRKQGEQDLRNVFPGLIVLPNIDADWRRLPRKVVPGKPVPLDHTRTRSGTDNEGAKIIVQISDSDARLLHFAISDGVAEFLAFTDSRRQLVRRKGEVFETDISGAGNHVFRLESTTMRGSPLAGLAAGASSFTVTVTARAADGRVLEEDAIIATFAPWLIHDNLSPPERLYMCEISEEEPIDRGNLPSVTEVGEIVRSLRGVDFVTIPKEVNNGDAWIQDQFQMGYCRSPGAQIDVVVHLPRLRSNISQNSLSTNLSAMVHSHYPSVDLGVFKDFYGRKLGEAATVSGSKKIIRFQDSFELSRRMDRVWNLWALVRKFYFKADITKSVRDLSVEADLFGMNLMGYFEARSKLASVVKRTRNILDKRADIALKKGHKELLQQQRAILAAHLTLVNKTIILLAKERKVRIPTDAFGDLVFTDGQIDDFDENMIGKHDSMNFGGNLEVSPPLKDAPLGKIAFGANRATNARTADADVVMFLESQVVQPFVDIETAWLDVAHVDEIMAFLPAPALEAKAAVAVASPGLGMAIIDAAFAVYIEGGGTKALTAGTDENQVHPAFRDRTTDGKAPITLMLRGRYWLHHVPRDAFATIEPPTIYLDMARHYPVDFHLVQDGSEVIELNHQPGQDRYYNASLSIREMRYFGRFTNDWLAENKILPLRRFLSTEFRDLDQIEIPVLYDEVNWIENKETKEFAPDFEREQTSAFLPNGVNMQSLGDHVLIPRQYGPRASPRVAARILQRAAPDLAGLFSADAFTRRGLDRTVHWIKSPIYPGASGSDLARIASQFKDGFPDMKDEEIREAILATNKHHFAGLNPTDELPDLKDGWRRLSIPEGRVDLFEAFIQMRLESIGLKVHFVDSWYYHIRFGEIHCGTNVVRRRPKGVPKWWVSI